MSYTTRLNLSLLSIAVVFILIALGYVTGAVALILSIIVAGICLWNLSEGL